MVFDAQPLFFSSAQSFAPEPRTIYIHSHIDKLHTRHNELICAFAYLVWENFKNTPQRFVVYIFVGGSQVLAVLAALLGIGSEQKPTRLHKWQNIRGVVFRGLECFSRMPFLDILMRITNCSTCYLECLVEN